MLPPIIILLLDIQGALINAIAPSLRAVTADIDLVNKKLILFFYYDGTISDELFDLASIAATEAGVSLPEYFTDDHIIQLDYPEEIPIRGKLVFLRKEPHLPNYKKESRTHLLKQTPEKVIFILDLQEALLGKVTPALRRVAGKVGIEQKRLIYYFVYDGKISEEEYNLAHAAIKEASASFPDYEIDAHIDRIDFPNERSIHPCKAAYLRYEPYN
jgi:hypothetical protein